MALHLITGGSGFVGSHIAEYLINKGEDLRIYDLVPPKIPGTKIAEEAEYIEGDVRNLSKIREAMKGIDYVHHTAALVPLTKAGQKFWEVNVKGTENVMKAALKEGVKGVTHISSSAVYDISEMPVTEETPLSPIGKYGGSKLESDRVVMKYVEKGLPANILRLRTVLDERRGGIYEILFDWMSRNKTVFMLGDGQNKLQLVSGQDMADSAFKAAVKKEIEGEIFNIGGSKYGTLEEDLKHLIKYADSNSSIRFIPALPARIVLEILDKLRVSPLAPWHYKTVYRDYYFDISKAQKMLGWEPKDSNFDMFKRAYDWYKDHKMEEVSRKGSVHRTSPKQKILKLLRKIS